MDDTRIVKVVSFQNGTLDPGKDADGKIRTFIKRRIVLTVELDGANVEMDLSDRFIVGFRSAGGERHWNAIDLSRPKFVKMRQVNLRWGLAPGVLAKWIDAAKLERKKLMRANPPSEIEKAKRKASAARRNKANRERTAEFTNV
jgi:hypothetical protein